MLPRLGFLARLTRDSEVMTTQGGMVVCKLGLACSEKYKEKETKLFITGTAFGKTAEFISSIQKGQRVFVFGKIQTEEWADSSTGEKRSKTAMIIESFEYVEPRQNQGQQNNGFQNQNQGFQQQPQQQNGFQNNQNQQNNGGFQGNQPGGNAGFQGPPDDSDIPF